MNRRLVSTFEDLCGQLQALYDEMSVLSKKSPDGPANGFKTECVNAVIAKVVEFLGKAYEVMPGFKGLDSDAVPSNSDIVLVLAQFMQSLERYRADHVVKRYGTWSWVLHDPKDLEADEDGNVYIPTVTPKRLRE